MSSFSGDCDADLLIMGGLRETPLGYAVRAEMPKLQFSNGLTSTSGNVRQSFSNPLAYAFTIYGEQEQFWRPGWEVNADLSVVKGAVVHETLHGLGFTDNDIQIALFGEVSKNTHNITQRLARDCFN